MAALRIFVLAVVVAGAFAAPVMDFTDFAVWKNTHSKTYASAAEEAHRQKVYHANLVTINEHNAQGHSFTLAMNHFGDLEFHEFKAMFLGLDASLKQTGSSFIPAQNVALPDEVDWRTKGAVTEVKNQGQCGSCYAFSTTGSLEGQTAIKTGKLVSLSEQQIVDCSASAGNTGCGGGLMDQAFEYIKANGGLDTEASYAYTATNGTCRAKDGVVGAKVSGHVDIASGNETDLLNALATVGPISIAIDASQPTFQFYSTGVYDEAACSSTNLDHGVLAVGYGTLTAPPTILSRTRGVLPGARLDTFSCPATRTINAEWRLLPHTLLFELWQLNKSIVKCNQI
eukprot:Opistho-2@4558